MIDIVIPTINFKFTDICLKSLRKRTKREDYNLIVVQDQATPEDRDRILKEDADFRVINNGFQAGVARVWNQGVEHMKTDYVLVANNDILFFDGWLPKLEKYAREHPEIGCLSAWSHWIGELDLTEEHEEKANHQLKDYSDSHNDHTQLGMQGCFFMLRRDVVEKLKAQDGFVFDEHTFPNYNWEDTDVLTRMRRLGYKDVIWHGCSLYHWGGRTVGDSKFNGGFNGGTRVCLENRVKYYKKYKIEHLLNRPWSVNSSLLYIDGAEVVYPS